MLGVLGNSWALLLGMLLLMVGNGLQGSLLGVRGAEAGFSSGTMSIVMSAYFAGFLFASKMAPELIRRVGHVRVFAALGSFISAVLILFPALQHPAAWVLGRLVLGFCFCGVYVTAESWLNNTASNETRGQTLSAYMIVQMAGIIIAQGLLLVPDVSGFLLFIIPSVLVSISFAPILLSISPTPAFESTKRMTLKQLYAISPLGMVGIFLLGGVFAAQFGMAAVYATEAGMTLVQTSIFIAAFYVGALIMQYPLGWISDRVDRRGLVLVVAAGGAAAAVMGVIVSNFWMISFAALVIGGASNPLYSLLIAYTNDFMEVEDMAAASAGLLFINGVGAITGPLIIGYVMQWAGPAAFFALIAGLLTMVSAYAAYRMTQRPAPDVDQTGAYAPLAPQSSPMAMEFAQEYFIDQAEEDE
ncbi:MFS transporter [Sagittula marina]|uniref:MFS transporter n=1 Tax=Sagittula marina TaxID=943940 RepID=UPI0016097FBA|nr:MFS transporter [Sagittula marina]